MLMLWIIIYLSIASTIIAATVIAFTIDYDMLSVLSVVVNADWLDMNFVREEVENYFSTKSFSFQIQVLKREIYLKNLKCLIYFKFERLYLEYDGNGSF